MKGMANYIMVSVLYLFSNVINYIIHYSARLFKDRPMAPKSTLKDATPKEITTHVATTSMTMSKRQTTQGVTTSMTTSAKQTSAHEATTATTTRKRLFYYKP